MPAAARSRRNRLLRLFAAVVAAAVVASPLRAQIADPQHTEAIEMARAAVGQLQRESGAPAIQAAVAVDGRIVWSEAFGFADVELRALATTETKFRIASISKSITGTLLAKLAAEGRIDLDAPVQAYVEAFPQKQAPITCRHLAGHISGIRHYRRGETASARPYLSNGAALTIFAGDDLEHDPGEKMTYSTYGYTLLGAAIEGAAGEPFGALVHRELLAPLGMTSTVMEETYALIPGRAAPYEFVGPPGAGPGRLRRATFTDHSYKVPGGGMLSTAEDLVRLGSALLGEGGGAGALSAEAIELALTSCTLNSGRATGYGLGWRVGRSGEGGGRGGVRSFGHGGSQAGSRTYLHVDAEAGVAVALLCNATGAPVNRGEAALIADLFAAERAAENGGAENGAAADGGDADGGDGAVADIDPIGRYELASTQHPERTATLEIWRSAGGRLRGSARIERRPILFDAVQVRGSEVTMLGFAARGLMRIRFAIDGGTVSGTLTAGDEAPFNGRRIGE